MTTIPWQCVVETSSGDLLRYGREDFANSGGFDAAIETVRFDVPVDGKIRGDKAETQMSRVVDDVWSLIDQPS